MSFIIFFLIFCATSDWKIFTYSLEMNKENCTVLQSQFAGAVSSYTACAVYYSRPIKLCEMCVDDFITIMTKHEEMAQLSVNTSKCIDYFINQDRLGIFDTMFKNSVDLWDRAKCSDCFKLENGQLTNKPSDVTLKFVSLYNDTLTCVNNSKGNGNNTSYICDTCMHAYITQDSYYRSISDENQKIGVCMDIVDLMNNTRRFWSKNCCEFRKHDEVIFLVSASGVLLLTFLFYVLVQWCAEKRTPTIFQQPRFVESLNNLHT